MCMCVKIAPGILNIIISGPDYAEVGHVFNVHTSDKMEDISANWIVANVCLIAQTKVELTSNYDVLTLTV